MAMKTAVMVVHGISPRARYSIQDEFAAQLAAHLNRPEKEWGFAPPANATGPWKADLFFPPIAMWNPPPERIRPTAVRVHRDTDPDPETPSSPVIDVFEAYWSPIDKNQTNALAVLGWMLKSLFVPANTSAKLYSGFGKVSFDVCYLATAMLLAVAFLYGTVFFGVRAYDTLAAFSTLGRAIGALAVGIVGAYLVVQGLVAGYHLFRQRGLLLADAWQAARRVIISVIALALGLVLIRASDVLISPGHSARVIESFWMLLAAAGCLRGLVAIGSDFLVNRLGDIQIYTTRNENSKFFALRAQIMQAAENVLLDLLRSTDDKGSPFYDRIFVAGHSLGSTVSLDALLRLHEMAEEQGLTEKQWRRLRGFITLGTALEKTKFFFDVQEPTISASTEQWRDDLYGHLFTDDFDALKGGSGADRGIYWANYWYFTDIVANEIDSYRSYVTPHERLWKAPAIDRATSLADKAKGLMPLVCQNARLASKFPLHVWVHGDYFAADTFWFSGLDVSRPKRPYHGVLEMLLSA